MSFNDDDWYEYNPVTMKIVRVSGPRAYTYQMAVITLPNGNFVVKGMRAKHLGLIP